MPQPKFPSEEERFFQALGVIYDRAVNGRRLALTALELLPEGDAQREFYTDAVDKFNDVILDITEKMLTPILEALAQEQSEAASAEEPSRIVLPA